MNGVKRKWINAWVMVTVLIFVSAGMASAEEASGTVSIETKSVAVGVGYAWGEGVLHFNGKDYPFKVKGLSVVDVGMSTISAAGNVYHLNDAKDFPGTFAAVEAGGALGGGAGTQAMKNQQGVVMELKSTKAGVKVKLAAEGLKVQMK